MEPQISTSTEPSRQHKRFTIVLAIIALVLILIIAQLFLPKFSLFGIGGERITGLEIAEKAITFIDKTYQEDGSFISGFACDDSFEEKCKMVVDLPEHTGQGIGAYYGLAKATGNPVYKEKADKAINTVMEKCKTNLQFCELNYFPFYQYYKDTNDQKYLDAGMLPVAQGILLKSDQDTIVTQAGIKLEWLYEITGEDKYKNKLLEVADNNIKSLTESPNATDYNMQLVWSVFIPAYKATRDQKYLDFINDFVAKLDIEKNPDFFIQPYSMTKASNVLLDLYDATGDVQYKNRAHAIMQKVLTDLWDSPEHTLFTGDYGFINTSESSKFMIFNGGIINQFMRLKDEKFEI